MVRNYGRSTIRLTALLLVVFCRILDVERG